MGRLEDHAAECGVSPEAFAMLVRDYGEDTIGSHNDLVEN